MPIQGLTNTPKAFMKLGNIRKGDRGGKNNAPRDLDHFRVTFNEGHHMQELASRFAEVYGDRPVSLNIRFAYHEVSEVWDANYECYKQGGLVAKAYTDETGGHWVFYRDPDSSEVLVHSGSPVGEAGRKFMETPCDVDAPIYKNANGDEMFMEPVGRLQVVIPELAHLEVGYFLFQPGSTRDIRNITAELMAYDSIVRQYGKTIAGVPFKLIRRKEEVPAKINGKLVKKDSWVVHLDAGGEWGRMAIEAIERLALPEIVDAEEIPYEDEFPEEETVSEPRPQLQPTNTPQPASGSDDEIIDALGDRAVEWAGKEWGTTTAQTRKEIRKLIDRGQLTQNVAKSTFKRVVKGEA